MTNRCVDIVVGLAAGSEGKGKLVSMIAQNYKALVRTGGPNAAHTVYFNGKKVAFHQIPCGALHAPEAKLILGANAQIDVEYLKKEIEILKEHNCYLGSDGKPRLVIDPLATIIDPIDKIAENGGRMPDCGDLYFHPRDCEVHNNQLGNTCMGCPKLPKDSAWSLFGSTTHGAGANLARKALRGSKMAVLAGQKLDLAAYVRSKSKNPESMTVDEIGEALLELTQEPIKDWAEHVEVEPLRFAPDDEFTKQFVGHTVDILNKMVDNNEAIMLEGTQGSLLSLHHSYWPKCTSRDTNASNWVTDAGLSPLTVREVYGVTRTFPIRVAGNSGPLSGTEISWDEVTSHATGAPVVEWKRRLEELMLQFNAMERKDPELDSTIFEEMEDLKALIAAAPVIKEITTATKRERRVFIFGEADFSKSVAINRPTKLTLTFVDYLNIEDKDKSSWDSLSQRTRDWITTLESKLGVFFNYLSTGPLPEHTVIRKSPGELVVQIQAGS